MRVAQSHKTLATELRDQGRLDEALTAYSRACEENPGDLDARQSLAELRAMLGQTREAIDDYQRVTGSYVSRNEPLKAIAVSKVILQLDPEHRETHRTLAGLFAIRDEGKDAPDPKLAAWARHPEQIQISSLPPIPLFSDLNWRAFVALVEQLQMHRLPEGSIIVMEQSPGASMYILVRGGAKVLREATRWANPELGANADLTLGEPGDTHVEVGELREGSFFGEMALLADVPRLATVKASEEVVLFELPRATLKALSVEYPEIALAVERRYKTRLLANLLRASPVFRPLDLGQRSALIDAFHIRAFDYRHEIIRQGRPAKGLFVLLRGRCEVLHRDDAGDTHAHPTLVEGAVFGEIGLLRDQPATATVRAASPRCVVMGLTRRAFETLVLPHAEVVEQLVALGRERLARTARLIAHGAEV